MDDIQTQINDLKSVIENHTHRGYDRTLKLPSNDITVQTFTAQENIAAGDPVRLVISSQTIKDGSANTGDSSKTIFGATGTQEKFATPFTPAGNTFATSVTARLLKSASPTDNVTFQIQTDTAGLPSGTQVVTSQGTIDASTLTTSFALYTITFPVIIPLTGGTQYWLVIGRSGARDTTNIAKIDAANSGGAGAQLDSGTWTQTGTTRELYVIVNRNDGTEGNIKKALGTGLLVAQVIGFAPRAIPSGQVGDVTVLGVIENLSGLTIGSTHYLSNTGTVSTTAGTYSKKLGIGLTATKLSMWLTPN